MCKVKYVFFQIQDYTKPWAMGAITVASVGAFTTVLCTVAIIAYWNTTIMRYGVVH